MDMERVHIFNSQRVKIAFVANQQGVFQVPSFFPCDYVGLANCLKVCFVYVLAHWLFATQAPIIYLPFMDVDDLREAGVPDNTDGFLASGH